MKSQPTSTEKGHFQLYWSYYFMFALAIAGICYTWYEGQSSLKTLQNDHQIELDKVKNEADSLLQINAQQNREMLAKTMGWVVAPLLKNNNQTKISNHFEQLVKYKGIESISLADNNQKILLSTNPRNTGAALNDIFQVGIDFSINETETFHRPNEMIVCQPVMNNERVTGVIVFVYKKLSIS